MSIESILGSIEGLLVVGFIAGAIIGFVFNKSRAGCLALFAVPAAMIGYISWWQGQHPEALRSTSGLDFLFGPLWPSMGAIVGYIFGIALGSRFKNHS